MIIYVCRCVKTARLLSERRNIEILGERKFVDRWKLLCFFEGNHQRERNRNKTQQETQLFTSPIHRKLSASPSLSKTRSNRLVEHQLRKHRRNRSHIHTHTTHTQLRVRNGERSAWICCCKCVWRIYITNIACMCELYVSIARSLNIEAKESARTH